VSSIALPVALPAGVDPASALWKQVGHDSIVGAGTELRLAVPGGEAWLLQSVACTVSTGGIAGNRHVSLELFDQNQDTIYKVGLQSEWIANTNSIAAFALGLDSSTLGARLTGAGSAALPWIVAQNGYTWALAIEDPLGTDGINSDDQWVVLSWDIGGSGAGAGAEPLGPFLYVPGPSASVAA